MDRAIGGSGVCTICLPKGGGAPRQREACLVYRVHFLHCVLGQPLPVCHVEEKRNEVPQRESLNVTYALCLCVCLYVCVYVDGDGTTGP